jgi:hypothetical protein
LPRMRRGGDKQSGEDVGEGDESPMMDGKRGQNCFYMRDWSFVPSGIWKK